MLYYKIYVHICYVLLIYFDYLHRYGSEKILVKNITLDTLNMRIDETLITDTSKTTR